MSGTTANRTRNRITLLLLLAVFVGPLGYAVWVYNTMDQPARMKNHGTLVQPPRPLPVDLTLVESGEIPLKDAFTGKWTLVVVGGTECGGPCRLALYKSRQSRLAQGEAVRRVQRIYLLLADAPGDTLERLRADHPDLRILQVPVPERARIVTLFEDDGSGGSVYVVDPLGNYMMRFDGAFEAKGLAQDLRLLLRASQIG